MKIFNLVKSEFVKNYSLKKLLFIILVITIFGVGLVEFTNRFYQKDTGDNYAYFHFDEYEYKELSAKENKSFEEEYKLYEMNIAKEMNEYIAKNKVSSSDYDWRNRLLMEINFYLDNNYLDKLILDNIDNSFIKNICSNDSYKPTEFGDGYASSFVAQIATRCDHYNDKDLDKKIAEREKMIDDDSKLLKENKYYLYLQYLVDQGMTYPDEVKVAKLVIDKKVEDVNDWRALSFLQYSNLPISDISDEKTYNESYATYGYSSYEDYVRYQKILEKDVEKDKKIILYSLKNNIKHDLVFDKTTYSGMINNSFDYVTSKTMVNQSFHLTIIVLILVCITSSGIVSNEHSKGTIKNIITTPVKRYKILLSKFIYLILHTYIIWLIGVVVLSIYAGIKFGFTDLITPKLIYSGGKVVEVNYYLYLLKDLFFASIPVIAFLSILFFLSTVTLNTALTTSVMTVLAIIPSILYFMCSHFNLNFLIYTPLPYFDCGFIFNKHEFYTNILKKVNMNLGIGIVASLITIIVLYGITNIIYLKRDIKS